MGKVYFYTFEADEIEFLVEATNYATAEKRAKILIGEHKFNLVKLEPKPYTKFKMTSDYKQKETK